MKKSLFGLVALFAVVTLFSNCKKDDEIKGFGSVSFEIENRAGSDELVFGQTYTNANGDQVSFNLFNYYLSNFILVKEDGTEVVVPKDSCYFLCKHEDVNSRLITINNVPAGNYKTVKFMIGVDSLKSVSDIAQRAGVLDPAAGASGMYWSWNAGYIFVKVEGDSPQAPLDANGGHHIEYHTGLFGGKDSKTLNNLKTVTITSTDETAHVREGKEAPQFHIYADVLEMFTSPTTFGIAANPSSHAGAFSKTIADNYANMFSLDHVHNHE